MAQKSRSPKTPDARQKPETGRSRTEAGKGKTPTGGAGSEAGTAETPKETRAPGPDQLGSLVTRGFDLAEAGLSLGLTLLNRVGSMAQDNLLEKITAPFSTSGGTNQNGGERRDEAAPVPAPESPGPGPEVAYISNRLPIVAGQVCRIPFSINNDSLTAPRKVKLACEGFVGEYTGTRFDRASMSVRPASRIIEPMDFEKFILTGLVPDDVPQDVYQGWIVVTSDSVLRIPVRIVVSEVV